MYKLYTLAFALLGAAVTCGAPAQTRSDASDPPVRVARLSYIHGAVSFAPAGEDAWVEAQLNRPIVTGDRLWTDAGAQVELQLGPALVELDRRTSFDFLDLDDSLAQMELTQGALHLAIDRLGPGETYEIDTPTIAFVADEPGEYRIDVDPRGGVTTVTTWEGGGVAYGEGGRQVEIEPNRAMRFADARLQDYQVIGIAPPDAFDRYVERRQNRYAEAPARYVSAEMTGYEDLSIYGSWDESPDYGRIWYPDHVAANWAPYHDGRWVWIDPWGWTWVDDEPWGFAPFHYGRWAYVGARWGWVPGPLEVQPVYAPALVAFVGGGVSLSISLGEPIGWFPLGPRDVYFPSYHCGHDYFTRLNIGGAYVTRDVVNDYYGSFARGHVDYARLSYANRDAPRAIAAMTGSAFVAGHAVALSTAHLAGARLSHGRILPRAALAPTRASLVAGRRHGHAPPDSALRRGVVAAHRPPPRRPSFAQRQPHLRQNPGRPLDRHQLRTIAGGQGHAARNVRVVGNGHVTARHDRAQARGDRARSAQFAHDRGPRGRGGHAAPARAETARAPHGRGQPDMRGHVRSAQYAHGPGRERGPGHGRPAETARHGRAVEQQQARVEHGRPMHGPTQRAAHSRDRGNGRAFAEQQHANRAGRERPQHLNRAERPQQASRAAQTRREEQARAQHSRRSEQARAAQHAQRVEHARTAQQQAAEQRRAAAASRAMQERQHARAARPERAAPQRAMAQQHRQSAPRHEQRREQTAHAAPQRRMHAPQRQQQARAPAPAPERRAAPRQQQHEVAQQQRHGPQNRQTASAHERGRGNRNDKGKKKDDDHPGGG